VPATLTATPYGVLNRAAWPVPSVLPGPPVIPASVRNVSGPAASLGVGPVRHPTMHRTAHDLFNRNASNLLIIHHSRLKIGVSPLMPQANAM
jgi:hypothetical protein